MDFTATLALRNTGLNVTRDNILVWQRSARIINIARARAGRCRVRTVNGSNKNTRQSASVSAHLANCNRLSLATAHNVVSFSFHGAGDKSTYLDKEHNKIKGRSDLDLYG